MFGYMGKVLRVNLSTGSVSEDKLNGEIARSYVGGRGFGARILFDELKAGMDPLSSDNRLVLATGPFAGTPIPGGSRCVLMAKSPLTGLLGDTDFGGYFG